MVSLRVYSARVVTPIVAPYQPEATVASIVRSYGLERKYGVEVASHIDRVFLRAVDPLTGGARVFIPGSVVRAALKEAAGLVGVPTGSLRILGAFFREEDVILLTSNVTKPNGEKTLTTYEAVRAGAEGVVYSEDDIEAEFPVGDGKERKSIRLPIAVALGGRRTRGMGRVVIARLEEEKKEEKQQA